MGGLKTKDDTALKIECHECGSIGARLYKRKGFYEDGKTKRVWLPLGWYCEGCQNWILKEHWVDYLYGHGASKK